MARKKSRLSESGFTLLEMMVSGTLFLTFSLELSIIWASFNRQLARTERQIQVDREARLGRAFLMKDLQSAEEAKLSFSGDALEIQSTEEPSKIIYTPVGPELRRESSAGQRILTTAKTLSTAQFSLESDGRITTDLVFEKRGAQSKIQIDYIAIEQEEAAEEKGKGKEKKKKKKGKKK